MTWQEVSRILDNEIKRNTEARVASQDMDLRSLLKQKSNTTNNTSKDKHNAKAHKH